MTLKAASKRKGLLEGRELFRFGIMITLAIVLGAVMFGVLDGLTGTKVEVGETIPLAAPEVSIPPIKRDVVARAKDDTPTQRFRFEPEIYNHLLQCASYIVPGTLEAMGLEDGPATVDDLRANPERWRGRPVAFSGYIQQLGQPVAIPGMDGFFKTEGLLKTDRGRTVSFAVIQRVPAALVLGSYARIAGFFFKLHDAKFPAPVERAPHIVGLELTPAFEAFTPVTKLDPALLATIDDVERPQIIPAKPLYHLTSYVMHRPNDDSWKKGLPSLNEKDARAMVDATGEVPRGKEYRILAELYGAQIKVADPNPLGIKYWTRAWVKHRAAPTIQVDIPGRVPGDWKVGDFVVFYGAFLQRHWYEAGLNERNERVRKIVPLFIADNLYHWRLVDNPANKWIRLTLTAITVLLIGLVAFLVFRDSQADKEVRQRILERRKRRRAAR